MVFSFSVFVGNISTMDVRFVLVIVVSSSLEMFDRSIKALRLDCILLFVATCTHLEVACIGARCISRNCERISESRNGFESPEYE